MFKIVIGNVNLSGEETEITAIFLNHIPVSHADVANMLNIRSTHGGFATIMDGTRFLNVYGCSISLDKSIDGIDKAELNKQLKENVFVRLPYHAHSYTFDIWVSVKRELVEQLVQTHDNFSDSVTVDFDTFSERAEESFREFFG